MIKDAIKLLVDNKDLSYEMTEEVMNEIMSGKASEMEMASYLTALRMKGETVEEITACANGMRKAGVHLKHDGMDVLEIVGTGGDEAFTFNISTVSGFVISACGVPVAKHGNRSVSSKCGAADCLESLGVKLDIPVEQNEKILKEIGMCFMFAQKYHSSMKYVAPVRKGLGIRTVFNILGPLSNPASANMQLMGVYSKDLVRPMAEVLSKLGVTRGMVVHGNDGLDEVTMTTTTSACFIDNGIFTELEINPENYGFKLCKPEDLIGGSPEINKQIALDILNGKETGAKRDIVILNSAVCLYIAGKGTIAECVELAKTQLDNGNAMKQLERFIELSNS
ncbi:MAG: anthranilate phosphoribosyltransferase [Methanosphaera sp.]|nr:anthranilate phosphoribosyltransferase [Methanosphaera sp.]MCD7800571.1 anthranilate phosphoribosyltransferase [Ruminococcus sp.]